MEDRDHLTAFRLADRLVRISPRPDPRLLFLRSKTLAALDEVAASRRDLAAAFALDPTDTLIAETIVRNALPPASHEPDPILAAQAAHSLVREARSNIRQLRHALELLADQNYKAAGNLRISDDGLAGWIAWRNLSPDSSAMMNCHGRLEPIELFAEGGHPAAVAGWCVTTVTIGGPWNNGITITVDKQRIDRSAVFVRRLPGRMEKPHLPATIAALQANNPPKLPTRTDTVTVIVPLYDDLAATATCLETLARQQMPEAAINVILVNDNPKSDPMRSLARDAAAANGFLLLENEINAGFVEAVNKALAMAPEGDVLLLNADVVLPDEAISRLREAAYGASDIGAVMPLSNNSELSSFPRPSRANPLGTEADVARIDAVAADINRGRSVGLPNAIGFCLFVRHDCRRAIGALPNVYHRGYYEDVEWCLRAREAGFRIICTADIYVGHHGTLSFKTEKTALVTRNLKVLDRRFPESVSQTAAYRLVDPLRNVRSAIEARLVTSAPRRRLVIGRDRTDPILRKRIERLQAKAFSVLTLTPQAGRGAVMRLRQEDDGVPQAQDYDTASERGCEDLAQMLEALGCVAADLFGDYPLSAALMRRLTACSFKTHVLIDSCPFAPLSHAAAACSEDDIKACASCKETFVPTWHGQSANTEMTFAALFARKGPRPTVMNRMARALLRRYAIPFVGNIDRSVRFPPHQSIRPKEYAKAVGIFCGVRSARTEMFLKHLVGALARDAGVTLIVIGQSFDEAALQSRPNVFVTGHVPEAEYVDVLKLHRVGVLIDPDRWGGFAILDRVSTEAGIAKAYFDWTFGIMPTWPGDLALDPRLCDAKAVRIISQWLSRLERGVDVGT